MSELTTNLNNILDIKGNIKSALENKGVDMTGVSFGSYPNKIGEITTSFVTVPLNVSANGTYTPGQGIDGYSQVVVDVPISGWDQKSLTEGTIEIINLDNSASFVANSVFQNNQNIKTVNLPYATSVGNNAFYSCKSLSLISLPVCGYISNYAFNYCYSLSQVDLPMCNSIGNYAFAECKSLRQLDLPMCSYIGNYAIAYCSVLNQLSLPMCSYISGAAFAYCSSLSIIAIGYSSVCSLGGVNVFYGTKITSSTGSIYVPTSLVDAYKSAANWSYFSTQIFPISE